MLPAPRFPSVLAGGEWATVTLISLPGFHSPCRPFKRVLVETLKMEDNTSKYCFPVLWGRLRRVGKQTPAVPRQPSPVPS